MRISYLNAEFLPHEKCLVHIEDRGFQFGDGAYEVTLFENGKFIDGDAHIERLFRSLRELKIEHNFSKDDLFKIMFELFAQNKMSAGTCYLNITRGVHARVPYVPKDIKPTINATVSLRKSVSKEEFAKGFTVLTHEDIRWSRCDIKSVNLLASTMVKQKSSEMGAIDAILIRDDFITEATFSNVFIVDNDDNIITKDADNFILQGITRKRILDLAGIYSIKTIERKFSYQELISAKEIFLTGTVTLIRPVLMVDGKIIGDGRVGEITKKIAGYYLDFLNMQNG